MAFGTRLSYAAGMRASLLLLSLASLLAASPGHAQDSWGERGSGRPYRHRPPSRADSLHSLAGPWQIWGHAGVGWIGSPHDVRSRYSAGLGVAASGDRRFGDRLAIRARLDYHDLPSTQPGYVIINGVAYSTNGDYGHAWMTSGLGGVSLRAWRHLWLEAGAGGGYFENGFPSDQTVIDGVTGEERPLDGRTGWGGAWSAGARYEFRPTLRDRLLAEFGLTSFEREGTTLHVFAVRLGYRAL
jgi:hypothetical protein